MKAIIFIIVIVFHSISMAHAQSTYRASRGHVIIVGEIGNQRVIAEGDGLSILLDYTTKAVSGRLNLKTMNTGLGSLDERISKQEDEATLVSFSGVIPVDDFITQPHLPVSFELPLTVTMGSKTFKVILTGTLRHFDGGNSIACILGASGEVPTEKTGLKESLPELSEVVKIEFSQVVLRKKEL